MRTLLAISAAFLVLLVSPGAGRTDCTGDCGVNLFDSPKAVEKYAKKAWKAVASCAKRGSPTCPTACAVPDATAAPYGLDSSCAERVACELQALAAEVYGAAWEASPGCAVAAADACGNARAAAGKLTATHIKRRRTGKMDKLTDDRAKCASRVDKSAACGGGALCEATGAWIDATFPLRVGKGHYQTLPFTVAAGGEGKAVLTLAAETADWGIAGRESVVLEYDVDGTPFGTLVVYEGELTAEHPILLGDLAAGDHTIGLRHVPKLSPAADAPAVVHLAADVTVQTPLDAGYDALRFAPVLLGIDRKLNVLGNHPGNAVSDVPVLTYVRAVPGVGKTTYRYVMIWSNEDGGTGLFPDVLFSQFGRTTDIENIVEVDVLDGGVLDEVRYRPDESGSLAVFAGAFFGTHPVVRTASQNGLIYDDGDSTLRFSLAPFEFDDSGVPREQGMDLDPMTYRVMAKEMIRELKTELEASPTSKRMSDPRNYVFVEYDIDVDVSGRVLRAFAVVGGVPYGSDHFSAPSPVLDPKVSGGRGRTVIELPPGSTLADITAYGMQGAGTMSGTLYRLEAFMLTDDFFPGTRMSFAGALPASGIDPTWSVAP
jgi:hypothetical protein